MGNPASPKKWGGVSMFKTRTHARQHVYSKWIKGPWSPGVNSLKALVKCHSFHSSVPDMNNSHGGPNRVSVDGQRPLRPWDVSHPWSLCGEVSRDPTRPAGSGKTKQSKQNTSPCVFCSSFFSLFFSPHGGPYFFGF